MSKEKRQLPQAAFDLVKFFEGLELKAYRCPSGILTYGWGHTGGVKKGDTLTVAEAEGILEGDLERAASAVIRLTKVDLNDNEYAALIDFVFNLGAGTYQSSTIRIKLNRGEYTAAGKVLLKYVYARGKKLRGLVRRRLAEYNLYMS